MGDILVLGLVLAFCAPYVLYPLTLWLIVRDGIEESAAGRENELPGVALVICALNEEGVIGEKILNSLALEYPAGKLRIYVISDGSTDRTVRICRQYAGRGVVVVERKRRRGKAWNLNELVPGLDEEVVVLSDANVLYRADAVKQLVARFEDATVGCVSGRVVLGGTVEALRRPEAAYYSLEWFLQERESRLYSMVSADGAMYAIRRELFVPYPTDTILDDFATPLGVIKSGRRVVFAPSAVGWEKGPASLREEFDRKVRIAGGAAQALVRGWGWPVGAPARCWFVFVSHKLLRWISPWTGALAIGAAGLAWPSLLSVAVLGGGLLFGAGATVRLLVRRSYPALDAMFYFLMGQVAMAVGSVSGLSGGQSVMWKKANR